MRAHMEAHDADPHERSKAFGQLGGRAVHVQAGQKLHIPKQPGVLGPG